MIGIRELNYQDYSISFSRSGANVNKDQVLFIDISNILTTNVQNNAKPVLTRFDSSTYLTAVLGTNHTSYAYIRFARLTPPGILTSNIANPIVGSGAFTDGIDRVFHSNRSYDNTYVDLSSVGTLQVNCNWQEPVDGYSPLAGDEWVANIYYRISLLQKV